jgi:hypothetical protein
MANPQAGDLQVNIPLTLIQSAYIQGNNDFIADQIFPIIGVQKREGRYWTFSRDEWYRSEAALRGPATQSVGSGFTLTSAPLYNCDVYAFHKDIDKQTRAETDAQGFFDIQATSTKFVTRQLLLKREQVWASKFFTTGIWSTNRVGASDFTQFDDAASTPVDVIGSIIDNVAEATGLRPNLMITVPRVMRALRRNAQIADLARSVAPKTGESLPTAALLQEVLEMPRVVVASTILNTSVEGQTAAYAPLYGKSILLLHVAETPSLETPSAGYIFNWVGYDGAGFAGNATYTFPMPELRAERVEAEMAFDMKVTAPDLGVYLSAVIP